MTTALPAYGRTYANALAAQTDWHKGKDFLESSSRRAFNRSDFPGDVVIRYGNNLEKVTAYDAKIGRKIEKAIEAEKAARPAQADTFEGWMAQVDAIVISTSGLSYQDLPDIDYRELYEGAASPKLAATEVLREAGF